MIKDKLLKSRAFDRAKKINEALAREWKGKPLSDFEAAHGHLTFKQIYETEKAKGA